MRRERARLAWQPQGNDQIAGLEYAFPLGRIAGQAMKRLERNLAPAGSALDLHDGVEGGQRHAEIRRVGGDAGVAPAEHGVQSILAVTGIATRARLALVAGAGGVVKIPASRPLPDIAADGRGIAKLRRCAGQKRLGHGRTGLCEIRVVREVGIANQRADADAAIGQMFDAVEPRQMRDIDETAWTGYPALHQVEQVGTTSEIGGAGLGRGREGLRDGGWPDVIEVFHAERLSLASARLFCASSTASVIPA